MRRWLNRTDAMAYPADFRLADDMQQLVAVRDVKLVEKW